MTAEKAEPRLTVENTVHVDRDADGPIKQVGVENHYYAPQDDHSVTLHVLNAAEEFELVDGACRLSLEIALNVPGTRRLSLSMANLPRADWHVRPDTVVVEHPTTLRITVELRSAIANPPATRRKTRFLATDAEDAKTWQGTDEFKLVIPPVRKLGIELRHQEDASGMTYRAVLRNQGNVRVAGSLVVSEDHEDEAGFLAPGAVKLPDDVGFDLDLDESAPPRDFRITLPGQSWRTTEWKIPLGTKEQVVDVEPPILTVPGVYEELRDAGQRLSDWARHPQTCPRGALAAGAVLIFALGIVCGLIL